MYSVVIPTIWKSKKIIRLIKNFNLNNNISEIIIIDNFPEKNFLSGELTKVKTKIFSFNENQYVNPSWNFGVLHSSQKYIALCNDDIVFNDFIFNVLNIEENTLFGINSNCYNLKNDEQLKINNIEKRCHGYGCLMFFQKKFYKKIPNELKIWYGDDFLFDNFEYKKSIDGLKIETNMSSSSKIPEFKNLILSDIKNWKQIKLKNI